LFWTIGKIFLSCCLYAFLSHIVLRIDYGSDFTILETIIRSFLIYSILFLAYSAIPLIIGILIAKIPKENRAKPIAPYVNYSLFFGWVISLFLLWGSWNANSYLSSTEEKTLSENRSNIDLINSIVKKNIEEIGKQTPIVIDGQKNLLSASYINDEVYYIYQFHSINAKEIDTKIFESKMIEYTKNNFCTDPDAKIFREVAGYVQVHWKYIDSTGKVITNLEMKGAECGEP